MKAPPKSEAELWRQVLEQLAIALAAELLREKARVRADR